MLRATLLASSAAFVLLAAPLTAQTSDAEAQRQAIFEQMINDPSNVSLMQQYARLSVQLREFEAAAATLERLLDHDPQNTAARVELAVAYFALGNYDVAEYHLAAAQRSGALSADQAAQVARYRDEVDERNDGSEYSGRLEIGYAYTDLADESGTFINAGIDWRIDMGGPHAAQWVTEAAYTGYNVTDTPFFVTPNNRQNFRIRTGPEFRLQGDAYGPRLQPYVELNWFDGDPFTGRDLRSWDVGLAYQNPLNEMFTVYGDFSAGYAEFLDNFVSPQGFFYHEVELGVTYRPSRDTRLRATVGWRGEETDEAFPLVTDIFDVRLAAQHAFEQSIFDVPNRWVIGGYADYELRNQPGFEQTGMAYAAFLRAFFYEDVYLEVSAAQITTDQDFGFFTFTTEETVATVQLGWEF